MNRFIRRRTVLGGLAGIAAAPLATPAIAQQGNWPERLVKVIVPWPAGGSTDVLTRLVCERLHQKLGQPFIVENKSGATGLIGMDLVAKSTDGHTLGVMFMPHTLMPALVAKMPYDTLADLAPVAQTQWTYNALVVRPSLGVRDVAQLLALARKNPGRLSFSSGGNGSPAHVMGEYFKQLSGTFILHVPYRGPVAALQDLVGGRSDLMFASVAAVVPHVQSGRLQAIAVTSAEPLEALPGVPTFAQAGLANFDVRDWAGIVAPRSLPEAAIPGLAAEIAKALSEPSTVRRFAQMGSYLHAGSPQAFDALIRSEIPKWAQVVRRAGIQLG
jgi:tripartite-type tricarboxylate transporter receptor subunit TctC